MRPFRPTTLLSICLILTLFQGCSKPTPILPVTLSEAHEKFLKLLDEEYGLNVVTYVLDNTMWIYLPLEENLFDFIASKEGPKTANESKTSPSVNFLDGQFEDETFKIQFDIAPAKKYAKSYGYSTGYSKEYTKKQRNILTAISRSYFAAEKKEVPEFLVLVVADIITGIETKMLFYFQDLKRGMTDPSFYEEYTRRFIIEDTTGHTDIIDDREGKHLELSEITWPVFLTKQIVYRIRVKYQRSQFPPSDDTREELLKIVARTVHAYDFTEFQSVHLYDLDKDAEYQTSPSELEKYKTEEKSSKGKLHTIRFVY